MLVGFDPARQAPFGAYELLGGRRTTGEDLAAGDVLVSRVLADKIDARVGDRLALHARASAAPPSRSTLRVAGIARQEGPGAYTLGAAVFTPLGTGAADRRRRGRSTWFAYPRRGDTRQPRRGAPDAAGGQGRGGRRRMPRSRSRCSDAKRAEVKNAEGFTTFIRAMLVGMSALVVAVGAALVVNIIGMLAEERRSRLGVLRALGLKRRRLGRPVVIEGAIYSLAAGVVGMAVGMPAGRLIASRFGRAFAEFAGEDFDFQFFFVLKPETLVTGFAIGSVLTLLVVGSRRGGPRA